MEKLKTPLLFTTFYLVFFALTPQVGMPYWVTSLMFTLSPFLVIWLVIRVLKDGVASDKQFSDGHWYEDFDINNVDGLNSEWKSTQDL